MESEKTVKKLTVKDWAEEDQPREKLMSLGKKSLSNAELIAILIGSGTVGHSSVELAKELLRDNGDSLSHLSRQSIADITKKHKGMGPAKAVTIIAALELGYRMLSENNSKKEYYCNNSEELFKYIGPKLMDLPTEEFWAIYMNHRHKVLFSQRISSGGLTETSVDIRVIFSNALEKNATCIAVAHNHPTGHLAPSKPDKTLTERLNEAGKILGIRLIEHIIVGINDDKRPDYYSFNDNGMI